MYAASFFKRVVNIPRSLCLVVRGRHVGGVISWGVMSGNLVTYYCIVGSAGEVKQAKVVRTKVYNV